MSHTIVSSKCQVVIPKAVRERAGPRPGQESEVIVRGNIVPLAPVVPAMEPRGVVKGIKTAGLCERGTGRGAAGAPDRPRGGWSGSD